MIDVSIKTSPCADPKILIGRQAENNAIKVVFDLSFLIQNFGEGTAVLVHQRTKHNRTVQHCRGTCHRSTRRM